MMNIGKTTKDDDATFIKTELFLLSKSSEKFIKDSDDIFIDYKIPYTSKHLPNNNNLIDFGKSPFINNEKNKELLLPLEPFESLRTENAEKKIEESKPNSFFFNLKSIFN